MTNNTDPSAMGLKQKHVGKALTFTVLKANTEKEPSKEILRGEGAHTSHRSYIRVLYSCMISGLVSLN